MFGDAKGIYPFGRGAGGSAPGFVILAPGSSLPYFPATMFSSFWLRVKNADTSSGSRGRAAMRAKS